MDDTDPVTVLLPGVRWSTLVDARGVAEITILDRVSA